jgi:hypothetical protein
MTVVDMLGALSITWFGIAYTSPFLVNKFSISEHKP